MLANMVTVQSIYAHVDAMHRSAVTQCHPWDLIGQHK